MEKQEKKKNKGLIVLIIILILIILGLTAYILYDKNIIFNNAKETVEKEKIRPLLITRVRVKMQK